MGLRLRKRIRIAPGININLGKRGASVSLGGRGATVNVGKKGIKSTAGIPGTGISYTSQIHSYTKSKNVSSAKEIREEGSARKVSLLLFSGILLMPYVFTWFLLRRGHSVVSRIIGFVWLSTFIVSIISNH